MGTPFPAQQSEWIGAKAGLFAVGSGPTRAIGYADVDWFRVQKESS
jgi:beta-xylosidase-like protein